jgi:hypothetical protein
MSQTPNSFIGRRVQVWSRSGSTEHRDDGILRAITNDWIAIENDKSEWLLFPSVSVRLVKVFPETDSALR